MTEWVVQYVRAAAIIGVALWFWSALADEPDGDDDWGHP